MRTISTATISDAVAGLCREAACRLPPGVVRALAAARRRERDPRARRTLGLLSENAAIARRDGIPVCQDTGVAFIWARLGQDLRITGGGLRAAIDRGVRRGYRRGRLRASVLADPLRGKNTGDNTPAFVHVELVPGDKLALTLLPKGAGAENMSALKMFPPSVGVKEITAFVTETVVRSWANACPPLVVGVGIGSTFDGAPLLAKQALLRDLGRRHRDPFYARLERQLLAALNATGIGPAGLGGSTTALAVHVETAPRHIASLAVAVNLQCHAARTATVTL
ncbi:fumarate hydratase [bacterium]|nr:fumarate hydratase [bacterium]